MLKSGKYRVAAAGFLIVFSIMLAVAINLIPNLLPSRPEMQTKKPHEEGEESASAAVEAEFDGIFQLELGMHESDFRRQRPNATLSHDIDEGRSGHLGKEEDSKRDKIYTENTSGNVSSGLGHMYVFHEGNLHLVLARWQLPAENAKGVVSVLASKARKRFGIENECIVRDVHQAQRDDQPRLCPELVWHQGVETIVLKITTRPAGDWVVAFFVRNDSRGAPAEYPIYPRVSLSATEQDELLGQFGVSPME